MEKSFVFKSVNGDRKYKAEDFREYFASFIGNGVFPNPSTNLQIIANNDMTITIRQGKAWINGAIYVNTEDYILTLDVADGVLNRIDRIVLRMDTVGRNITAKIKKGAFASTPVALDLQRDADAYEIALADIYISKGAISITQSNVTDLRLNNALCGIVHGTVDQVDTTTLFNQYQTWFAEKQAQYNNDLDSFTTTKKQAFTSWYSTTTTNSEADIKSMEDEFANEFNTWFASIKNVLSGDTAGNLLNLINDHKNDKNNPHAVTVAQIGAVSKEDFDTHKADTTTYSTYKLSQDSYGIFTEVDYKRKDGTLILKSVLSGGTAPNYATRTQTEYAADGTTVTATRVYTIAYNSSGDVISEVLN